MLLIDPTGRGLPVHSCYPPVLEEGILAERERPGADRRSIPNPGHRLQYWASWAVGKGYEGCGR